MTSYGLPVAASNLSHTRINGLTFFLFRYAVDTVTGRTKEVYIQYPNNYKQIVQIQYNMREKTLFVWDNGRQIIYALDFVY